MSAQDVRDRLGDRFRLLSGSRRGLERHQTLRHAVAWSYDLLDDDERTRVGTLFGVRRRVRSGRRHRHLRTASTSTRCWMCWIRWCASRWSPSSGSNGHARYGMLETIRQFAEEQLAATGTIDEVRDRHAALLRRAGHRPLGPVGRARLPRRGRLGRRRVRQPARRVPLGRRPRRPGRPRPPSPPTPPCWRSSCSGSSRSGGPKRSSPPPPPPISLNSPASTPPPASAVTSDASTPPSPTPTTGAGIAGRSPLRPLRPRLEPRFVAAVAHLIAGGDLDRYVGDLRRSRPPARPRPRHRSRHAAVPAAGGRAGRRGPGHRRRDRDRRPRPRQPGLDRLRAASAPGGPSPTPTPPAPSTPFVRRSPSPRSSAIPFLEARIAHERRRPRNGPRRPRPGPRAVRHRHRRLPPGRQPSSTWPPRSPTWPCSSTASNNPRSPPPSTAPAPTTPPTPPGSSTFPTAVDHLRAVLGETAFDQCVAAGAAMEPADAVAYARDQIQAARRQIADVT